MSDHQQTRSVVLITGAAGGLGRALAAEFIARGWNIVAAHHRPAAPPKAAQMWPVQLDVTNRAQVESVVARTISRFGRLDALINNAGAIADSPVMQMDETEWDRILDVNLKGVFLCSQAAIGLMVQRRDGHIINVSSFSGRAGNAGQANYAAAKAGVIGLTQSLAKEAGSGNVRVNAVLPGVLATAMTAGLSGARMDELISANTLTRLNDVTEVARFIGFLATTHNISGQLFQLDSRIPPWT